MLKKYSQMIAKLRSGTLPIHVETGQYNNVPLQNRVCNFCYDNKIKDEIQSSWNVHYTLTSNMILWNI